MDPETLAPLAPANPAVPVRRSPVRRRRRPTRGECPPERLIAVNAGERGTLAPGVGWRALASAHEELQTDAAGNHLFLGYVIELGGTADLPLRRLRALSGPGRRTSPSSRSTWRSCRSTVATRSGRPPGFRGISRSTRPSTLCRHAGIAAMLACHFGMFDFNTVDESWLDEQIAALARPSAVRAAATSATAYELHACRSAAAGASDSTTTEDHAMKARLVPLYFDPGRDADFDQQLAALRALLADQAELLAPRPLGAPLPEADAVRLSAAAGRGLPAAGGVPGHPPADPAGHLRVRHAVDVGLGDRRVPAVAKACRRSPPTTCEQTRRIVCRAWASSGSCARRSSSSTRTIPAKGFQASIFKRFYWWEDECTAAACSEKFGVTVVKKSFRELGARAKAIPDAAGRRDLARLERADRRALGPRRCRSAAKLYLAVRAGSGRATRRSAPRASTA